MDVHGYTSSGMIDATIDGQRLFVPDDLSNRHRRIIAKWESGGNVIPAWAPPPPTTEAYEAAVQAHVDTTARERLFRDGVTLASYVASTNPRWAAEAQAFVAWRDQVWTYAHQQLSLVLSGEREQPTIEGIIAELPLISWPASPDEE